MRGKEAAFPKGWQRARGIVTGVMSLEAIARERKEGKDGSIAWVRRCSLPGPGKRVIYKYAMRVEADGVILCPMLSRIGKAKEGEQEF